MAEMNEEKALFEYTLRLGDNNLILGHRISEWCGHGPILEQDIALINIALDLLGQATSLLEYAAKVEGKGRSADDLAYLRTVREYKNVLLAEQPNGHFGDTLARQFFYDAFHYAFLEALTKSSDETLAAIAAKSLKEVAYHVKYSSEWMIRLGDGTEESHQRIQQSVDDLWMYTGELFEMDEVEQLGVAKGWAPDLNEIKPQWQERVQNVLKEATLEVPENNWAISGGKRGEHSEHLGYILSDLQYLQRTYPGAEW
jgi:ring-1,2-phenylacetyl-CoA epoxidase subunit PaaC